MTADEPRQSSRAAGGCVLVALVGAVTAAVFAASTSVGVLAVLGAGTAALWWSVRRPNKIHNPSPPPPQTPSVNTEVQVRSVGSGAGLIVYPAGERITHHVPKTR